MLIALQPPFRGERPRVDPRLLDGHEAQVARNCKLWKGILQPWLKPLLHQVAVNAGPILSIYRYAAAGHWLHWNTDVDVARGPVAGTQRLYWTNEGAPKLGNAEVIAGISALTQNAPGSQNFVIVNNAKGFEDGAPISIALDVGGPHVTTITTVQLSLNRLNLAVALPSQSSIGKLVTRTDKGYPHGSYLLGVPAPANALSTALNSSVNAGTVVNITSLFTENTTMLSNTTVTTAQVDITVDSDGAPIEFVFYANFATLIYGVQNREIRLKIIRDPAADNKVLYELAFKPTFQGTNAADNQPNGGPLPQAVEWRTSTGHGAASGTFGFHTVLPPEMNEDPRFVFTPDNASHVYRLLIEEDFTLATYAGGLGVNKNFFYLRLQARVPDRVTLQLNTASHGLKEGDTLQLGGIVGTGTLQNLNGERVPVLQVNGALVSVQADATGSYTSGGTWTQVWDESDLESRSYVYTYVATLDGKDMESAPSTSTILLVGDNQGASLTGFIDPTSLADGRPYTSIRIYRTSVGDEADAEFLFVAQVALNTTTYVDQIRGTNLGEQIPSTLWEVPPSDLVGLVELPNGVLAGFRFNTNELCLSFPYQPHAWPFEYRHSMLDTIVGIAAFGTSVLVGTTGRPTVVTGSDPATLSEEHIEVVHPCLAKRGMVDMGYAILYPSETGLCYVAEGEAAIITEGIFSSDDWKKLNPASFIAAKYHTRYICFYDNGTEQAGFILDPKDPNATLTFLDFYAREVWSDPRTDKFYMVLVNAAGDEEIVEWDADLGSIPFDYRWRSKEYVAALPESARVVKVDAKLYPVIVNVYGDGEAYDSVEVFSEATHRLKDAGLKRKWEVEVIGSQEVEAVYVASNMTELTRYLGG